MSQLVCPLCSESLKEEGSHFFKHFKYKRYACGTSKCDTQFYTEADREAHCTTFNHKRSFQKTVNPYIDKMIAMVVHDARELATKDMEEVLENRFGDFDVHQKTKQVRITSSKEPTTTSSATAGKKRTTLSTPSSTATVATKKSRTSGATPTVPRGRGSNASVESPTRDTSRSATSTSAVVVSAKAPTPATIPMQRTRTSSNIREQPTATSSASALQQTPPSRPLPSAGIANSSSEVDSTTSDNNLSVEKSSTRRRKKPSENGTNGGLEGRTPVRSYESMSAVEKLTGFYDKNEAGLVNAVKTVCQGCNKEIAYDFLVRIEHVTSKHMAADVAEEDYNEILKTEMDRCYPECPNSKLACQTCVDGREYTRPRRREHIELVHHTMLAELQALKCPIEGCGVYYIRQCELSVHMKENHKIFMSKYKDIEFKYLRDRRNQLIDQTLRKCFPWSEVEKIDYPVGNSSIDATKRTTSGSSTSDLNDDVRLRDANRTRRAMQHNEESSDDEDSNDSNAEDETSTTTTSERQKETREAARIDERDVIFISQKFQEAVLERLGQSAASQSLNIKKEVMDTLDDVRVEDFSKEDAPETTVEENPNSSTRYATPMVISYEPIVPPPPAGSPDPVIPAPSTFILNQVYRSPDNGLSVDQPMKESPRSSPSPDSHPYRISNNYRSQENGLSSSSNRPRITYNENRGAPSGSWSRPEGSTSSSSYNQHYHRHNNTNAQIYRPNSYRRGVSSRYGSTAYNNRHYNNTNDSSGPSGSSSASSRHREFQSSYSSRQSTSNTHRFLSDRGDRDTSTRDRSSRY